MKIYISHSKELNFKEELYQPIRESQLNSEHEIILPHELYEEATNFVTRDIIKTCDVMIAEVSFAATGMGIELGFASAFERPIICIYKKGTQMSGSLKVITDNFIEYTNKEDLIQKLSEALKNEKYLTPKIF